MLCFSKWLAKLYAWLTGKESTASCEFRPKIEDD